MRCLTDCAPPHFAVYCLEPGGVMEAGVGGFFAGVDVERSAEEYLSVCESLGKGGYQHYEVSNFARPGHESRHNRTYWRGGEYLGIGPGAHSFIGGERWHNEPSIERYVTAGGASALRHMESRDDEERLIERYMLSLRTSDGLPMQELQGPKSVVDDLLGSDLAVVVDDRLVLTDRGFLVLNEIVLRLTCSSGRE
jgi:oxygen-independent coproporphyrinogen-3 oxidase